MKMSSIILLCFIYTSLHAQLDNKALADSLGKKGIEFMDIGQFEASIAILNKAKALDPDNQTYDYEIGLAYYMQENYKEALKIFKKLTQRADNEPLYFKMLGNTYDLSGNRKKAKDTYKEGLKKYPDYGPLYLELGLVNMMDKQYTAALFTWETGILRDPSHASNYYWAARMTAQSTEKIWALLYGEIFLNLEPGTRRSQEISALLYETYQNVYKAETDTSGNFKLTERGFTIRMDDALLNKIEKGEQFHLLPFEGVYAMAFSTAAPLFLQKNIKLAGIYEARKIFLDQWFNENNQTYPNTLFDFQKTLKDKDFFDCYTYWLFSHGSEEEFNTFYENNKSKFEHFVNWINENPIVLENGKFCRLHYINQ
ncbi:MAG: tetratricopeptide repeat protein [Saprospiraceae bacterium]